MEQENFNPYAAPLSNGGTVASASFSQAQSAGSGKRFMNLLIDQVALFALSFFFGILLSVLDEHGVTYRATQSFAELDGLGFIFYSCMANVIYYGCLEGGCGRSLGKWITGTRVVTVSGQPLTLSDVLKRSLYRLMPFEGFSFLGGEDEGWHDKWSGTRVIDLRAKPVCKPRPMNVPRAPRMHAPRFPTMPVAAPSNSGLPSEKPGNTMALQQARDSGDSPEQQGVQGEQP